MLLQKLRIDDPVDASPVHGFCGAWGLIAAGLFDWGRGIDHYHGWSGFGCMEKDDGGCQTGIGGTAIGVQFIMILAIVAWAGTLSGHLVRDRFLPAEGHWSAALRHSCGRGGH